MLQIFYQDFRIDWILGNGPHECFTAILISTCNVRSSHRIGVWDPLVMRQCGWIWIIQEYRRSSISQNLQYTYVHMHVCAHLCFVGKKLNMKRINYKHRKLTFTVRKFHIHLCLNHSAILAHWRRHFGSTLSSARLHCFHM